MDFKNASTSHILPQSTQESFYQERALDAFKKDDESFVSFLNERTFEEWAILWGTSKFLFDLGNSLRLSLSTMCTALLYLNRFFGNFGISNVERKLVSGACILLAWKHHEDIESERSPTKLMEITKMIYRILASDSSNINLQRSQCNNMAHFTTTDKSEKIDLGHTQDVPKTARSSSPPCSSKWILNDKGAEFSKMREKIRMYETGLLRSIQYSIGAHTLPFPLLRMYCRRIVAQICVNPMSDSISLDALLLHRASLFLIDCYRSPLCLKYETHELVVASIWKAFVFLNLRFKPEPNIKKDIGTEMKMNHVDSTTDIHFDSNVSFLEDHQQGMKHFANSLHLPEPLNMERIRSAIHDLRQLYEILFMAMHK